MRAGAPLNPARRRLPARRRAPRRGAVAVVVVTVLLLFALVALTIFSMTRLQRPEVPADTAGTRALMLAHAGVERALQDLPRAASRAWQSPAAGGEESPGEFWTWWGEDTDADGILDSDEDANRNGRLDVLELPIDEARRPSLAQMRGGAPETVLVDGRLRGLSGHLAGMHQPLGDHYVLRIADSSSRLWLNGPADRTLAMLTRLCRRLGLPDTVAGQVVTNRPGLHGWRTEEDLIPFVGEDAWRRLAPFVTAHAWSDPRTLALCPLGSRLRPTRPGEPVWALGDLRPRSLELQRRAPVNLNSAPEPVLAAVFEGVSGAWVEELPAALGPSGFGAGYDWLERPLDGASPASAVGILRAAPPVSAAQADQLAAAAVRWRRSSPFRTWQDVRRFLDASVRDGLISGPQAEALRANADPNALLNDFNPDANAWAPIDKTDLLSGTTEFCFSPMGFFVVESLGRVVDAAGKTLARRLLKVHVRAYEVWRETVESEFLAEIAGGAEPDVQISLHDGDGATRGGLSLEILPDAFPDARQDRKAVDSLWYDGRIGLATLAVPGGPETWLRATLTPPMREALEADDWGRPGDPSERRARDPRGRRPQATGEPVPGALIEPPGGESGPASPEPTPGHLFPDGAYLERNACLRYRADDNLPRTGDGQTRSGCVSFWLKPAFDPARASRPRTLWSVDRRKSAGSPGIEGTAPFGAWLFPTGPAGVATAGPYAYGFPLRGLAGFGMGIKEDVGARSWVAAGVATGRSEFEAIRPRRWVHLAFAWDLDQPAPRAFRMAVNGNVVPPANAFEQIPGSLPLSRHFDLTANAGGDATWISFGALGADPRRNFPLDATVDEIRVGTAEAFEAARRDAVEGRYVRAGARGAARGEGAVFTSAPRRPPSPAIPGSIAWTVRDAESLPDSTVRLQFWDGRRWRGPFDDAGGQELGEEGEGGIEGDFRWRAVISTGARPDEPVLETPWLDDVTITYAAKPAILAWSAPPAGAK